ncbi:MAG TPA: chemotaxis response regulator protein-glutamate methylesterase [Gemmataceae bacterium]|nr:chemotaxis response regulator protein-glutamate methylesterase [Gemmataceae bacterium]
MAKIRVLVVDDAVVFRRLVAEELARNPALEVVGTAANGRIGLAKLSQLNPDVVVLDLEMPEMNGLEMLRELRKSHRRLPVIMFSSLTERGATETIEALALGASDYFTKPASSGGMDASLDVIRRQLVPQIKALAEGARARASRTSTAKSLPADDGGHEVRIVAIGASTGGPTALAEIFTRLPGDLGVPIVLVQHMPPMFTRLLAERLTAQSPVRVQEGATGTALQSGQAWIAPGDFHMAVTHDGASARLHVHREPPENSCRPAVDVLFRSVAKVFGKHALAVLLTGMGHDGVRGCEAVREAGGRVIVQDEATSVVWGMPGQVAKAGLANRVLPISMIADEIMRSCRQQVAGSR